jgi:hypothetical protein
VTVFPSEAIPDEIVLSEDEEIGPDDSIIEDELYQKLFRVSAGHFEVLDNVTRKSAKAASA